MGKDKKWMEETRAAWASLMHRGLCGEYDGGSQSRKNPKTSEWEIPRRSATEQWKNAR